MNNMQIRWKNAQTVIAQLKNDEWAFRWNAICRKCLTAHKDGRELWVSNGPFSCDVDEQNVFGYLFRHYVWWAASRGKTKQANKKGGILHPKTPIRLWETKPPSVEQ